MKTSNREKLLQMDLEISFPFILEAHVRFMNFGKINKQIYTISKHKDLLTFVYWLVNPLRHNGIWLVNGDNYISTIFYKKGNVKPDVLHGILASHTMRLGLQTRAQTDNIANEILATF